MHEPFDAPSPNQVPEHDTFVRMMRTLEALEDSKIPDIEVAEQMGQLSCMYFERMCMASTKLTTQYHDPDYPKFSKCRNRHRILMS